MLAVRIAFVAAMVSLLGLSPLAQAKMSASEKEKA
jgi:hypothetical protein